MSQLANKRIRAKFINTLPILEAKMAHAYSIIYSPYDEMVSAAYRMMDTMLANGAFSNGIVPIRKTRDPIIAALFKQYGDQIIYRSDPAIYGHEKAPRRIRNQLLMREFRQTVEEAAIEHGLERRNVLVVDPNRSPSLDHVVKGTAAANANGRIHDGNVYWVKTGPYHLNQRLTDHIGPQP